MLTAAAAWLQMGTPASKAATVLDGPTVFTQVPRAAEDLTCDKLGGALKFRLDWFRFGAQIVLLETNGHPRVLSSRFHSACDPSVSFDGRRLLFAGRKGPIDSWNIWEMDLRQETFRQITTEQHDCRSPIYLSSLFTLDSPEPWFTALFVRSEGSVEFNEVARSSSLYSVKLDGTELRRVTFNPLGDFDPVQTMDGRVVYAGVKQNHRFANPLPAVALFSVHIDGMEQELYGGEQGKQVQHMPCVTEKGLVVFVEGEVPARWDGAGQLGSVLEQRPYHSYRRITSDQGYAYLYPAPWRGNSVLVSRRRSDGTGPYELGVLDADSGKFSAAFVTPDYHAVQARVVRPRPVPDGRSTVVDPKYTNGVLYALNCYQAESPWPPGSIARVRLIEGLPPAQSAGASAASPHSSIARRLLGEAPVEPDGSFHVQIPADIPIELQTLDSNGLALATCRWIWVRPKENRGCIGCHEDPELMPENSFAAALARPSNQLTLPPEKRRRVGFREQIIPILRSRCALADCHGGADTPLLMALSSTADDEGARKLYAALLARDSSRRPQDVDPGAARTSFLIAQLFGRAVGDPRSTGNPGHGTRRREIKQMPPAQATPLRSEELRLFIEWIDLGAPWETPNNLPGAAEKTVSVKHENERR